jgi:hypothetical protein
LHRSEKKPKKSIQRSFGAPACRQAGFTEGIRVFESEGTAEYGHGRMEIRNYYLETDTSWLEQAEAWAGLKGVGMVTSCVFRNGKSTCSTRYYITSLTDVDEFA